jgi:hypothetical protein
MTKGLRTVGEFRAGRFCGIPPLRLRSGLALAQRTRKDGAPGVVCEGLVLTGTGRSPVTTQPHDPFTQILRLVAHRADFFFYFCNVYHYDCVPGASVEEGAFWTFA